MQLGAGTRIKDNETAILIDSPRVIDLGSLR